MQNLKSQILDRGAAFLNLPAIQKRLDEQTKRDIASGKKEYYLADFYIRKKITGDGIVDIMKETDSLQAGVTNIDKAKLYSGTFLALTGLGLSYGFTAAGGSTNADAVDYSNAIAGATTIPTRLVNSEFTCKVGGSLVLKSRTKRFLARAATEYSIEANDENTLLLPVPKLIEGDKKIELSIEFPQNGAAFAAGNHFVEIRMQGVYIGDR